MGLVGPTLGDAVTSGVEGPSGLRKWDPGLKIQNKAGGTQVTMSNGAQIKLFGAYQKEDVERFRSGGNRCLTADTLVDGVPITEVPVGSYVRTRNGQRKVLANTNFGIDRIWKVSLSNGTVLRCTADHRHWVEGTGWVTTDSLTYGAKMVAWQEHQEPRDTSRRGQMPMGQSRKGMSFITRIMTRATDAWRILKSSLRNSTGRSMEKSVVTTGTAKEGNKAGPVGHWYPSRVWNAEASLNQRSQLPNAAATVLAERSELGVSAPARPKSTSATTALNHSAPGEATLVSVVSCVETEEHEEVHCLTVEGDHEFFANGVLTGNCFVWAEEMAAWRYLEETWEQIRYGLRVGPRPHVIISTTPKARKLIKKLVLQAKNNPGYGVITSASTFANPHLDERVKEALREDYEGTRMGRQELYAELLEDNENGLFIPDNIERYRLPLFQYPDQIDKIVVGVDPQAKEGGDNTGIIVAGTIRTGWEARDKRSHGFILGDNSRNGKPEQWAQSVVAAFNDFEANEVVAEINNGGDMVKSTLRTANGSLPIHVVHATRGKDKRAEPVSALYEQGRIHHVGNFPELEEEMVDYDPVDPDTSWSPDRMDAMVWAITRLMVKSSVTQTSMNHDAANRGRR